MRSINKAFALAAMVVASLSLGACGEEQAPQKPQARVEPPPAGQLWVRGAGATFPDPLYQRWVEEYQANNPGVWVTYEPVGSGAGVSQFIAGSVDFGASDAAMTDEELARVDRGAHMVPATAGIVVLAYNIQGLEGELRLPREVYANIFLGKITKWNDPLIQDANPDLELPNRTIHLVARQDSSGTTFAFTNHLSAVSTAFRVAGPGVGKLVDWPGNTMLAPGNEGVAQRIKISDGAIGYIGYEFAQLLGLPMATMENKAGRFVRPGLGEAQVTLKSTADQMPENLRQFIADPEDEAAYPIVTYTWLLLYDTYPNERKKAAVKDFATWALTNGQSYAVNLGFVPLPQDVAVRSLLKIDGI